MSGSLLPIGLVILVGLLAHREVPRQDRICVNPGFQVVEPSVQMIEPLVDVRRLAHAGSAVDALLVALAEPDGTVITGDRADLEALAAHADRVAIEVI